jgi:hypothetical protein
LLIETTNLTKDDPRIVTSMPRSKWFLPVSINNRYVLAPWQGEGVVIGIIYGPEFEAMPDLQKRAAISYRYKPLRGEGIDTPFFIEFESSKDIFELSIIVDGWLLRFYKQMAFSSRQ